MSKEPKAARKEWKKALPHSEMVYPHHPAHRIKYHFWRLYAPLHPMVRNLGLPFKYIKYPGRSELFLLGTVAPHSTPEKIVERLIAHGYGYHRIAWEDDGELVGLRKVENFFHQYHIRIYEDGEVRGHYEFTPEAYPILHLYRVGQVDRREEFLTLLKGHLIEHTLDDRA